MFTPRMFDMWSSVTSKLEAQTQIQTNIQQTSLQNSSSGSIKGKHLKVSRLYGQNDPMKHKIHSLQLIHSGFAEMRKKRD